MNRNNKASTALNHLDKPLDEYIKKAKVAEKRGGFKSRGGKPGENRRGDLKTRGVSRNSRGIQKSIRSAPRGSRGNFRGPN